jgi:N-acetylneuraminic acid mutarotase
MGEGGSITLSKAELYDALTGSWTVTGGMSFARSMHTASVLPNGKMLVAGGENIFGPLSTAELYDPSTETWTTIGDMNYARQIHTASVLKSGKVLITGGDNYVVLNSTELY